MISKRKFQATLTIFDLIAAATGLLGIVSRITPNLGDFDRVSVSNSIEGNIILDSNLRFFLRGVTAQAQDSVFRMTRLEGIRA